MGRGVASLQPPVTYWPECFHIRQDGALCWRERPASHFPERTEDCARFNAIYALKPAGFPGPNGEPMVRVKWSGRTRRMTAARAAFIVAHGRFPKGAVSLNRPGDYRPASLIEQPYRGNRNGGVETSLPKRAEADARLLTALASHVSPSLSQLAGMVRLSKGNTSSRLKRFAERGWACGPECCPARHWHLTALGREQAEEASLTERVPLTNGHRVPWLDMSKISAAASREVRERTDVPEVPTAQIKARLHAVVVARKGAGSSFCSPRTGMRMATEAAHPSRQFGRIG